MNTSVSVTDLLRDHPVIDGHNDLPWALRELHGYDFDEVDIAERQDGRAAHRPAAAARRAAWGPSSGRSTCRRRLGPDAAVARPSSRSTSCVPDDRAVRRSAGAGDDRRRGRGGRARPGGSPRCSARRAATQIDGSLACCGCSTALGVRYLTLTHNENVAWADSATDEPVLGGLNDVRPRGRRRDEPPRHDRRPLATCRADDDAGRPRRRGGAGDLLPLLGRAL